MKRNFLVVVLLTIAAMVSLVALADDQYYDIGSNPAAPDRVVNPDTEAIVKTSEDSPVLSMTCAGGKVASGKKIREGQMIVVDKTTHVAKWVAVCGNDITNPTDWIPRGQVMYVSWKDIQSAPTAPVTQSQPAASTRQQVDINVHQDRVSDNNSDSDQPQEHYGFWDMVAASFAQAFAQGLGQGLAYRMVWDGGGYGGYGYGFAPIVYYPPPAYYGGGGGGVFITKYVTKNVYINSFNSSTTTITNPGGPRGGGGPVDPPADPGSGGGGTGGGGPVDPGANLRAQRNAGRGESAGTRKPLTESQIARDFRGQSGARSQAHGPTVGNDAWTPSARGGERYQPPSGNSQRGGRQIMPSQRQQPRVAPRQNSPRYGTQPSRGWSAPRAPQQRFSAPTRPSAPAFRGGRR